MSNTVELAMEVTDPRYPHLYVIDDELCDKLEAVANLGYDEVDVHTLAAEALAALQAGESAAQDLAVALRTAIDIIRRTQTEWHPAGDTWIRFGHQSAREEQHLTDMERLVLDLVKKRSVVAG